MAFSVPVSLQLISIGWIKTKKSLDASHLMKVFVAINLINRGAHRRSMCCMDTGVATEENPRHFLTRPFYCGFCSAKQATEVSEVSKQVSSGTPTVAFHADALENYGRSDHIQISGVIEEENE